MKVRALLYLLTGMVVFHLLCVVADTFLAVPAALTAVLAVLEPSFTALISLSLSRLPSASSKAWRTCGIAFIIFLIGVAIDGVRFVQGQPLSPSWADPFLTVGGTLFILAMLYLPRPDTLRLKGLRLFADVAVQVVFFMTFVWRFAFAPQLVTQQAATITVVVQTVFLLLNFSVFGIVLTLLFWTRFSRQFALLTLGIGCFVSGNFLFTLWAPYQNMSSAIPWVVACMAVGHAVFCWGIYATSRQLYDLSVIDPVSAFARLVNRLPYASIISCYALILVPPPKNALISIGVIVGIVLITIIVLARQYLHITDNEKLTRELQLLSSNLEARVLERSKELEDSQSRLLASEKLASLGRLTAGLAHEINTPLAAAMHSLYQAKELVQEYKTSLDMPSVTKDDYKEIAKDLENNLGSAQTSLERLGEFVRRMRSQTRGSSDTAMFYPSQVIRDVIAVMQPKAQELEVTLGFFEPKEAMSLHGDATRFSQVISNLLSNALDACEGRTNSFVNVRLLSEEDEVRLEVHDNGVGISEDIKQKIFEPMFTTKDVGQGTGLGLAVVYDIVHGSFGGEIEVQSVPGQGSTFIARFPLSVAEAVVV